jgi:hypothetical protein
MDGTVDPDILLEWLQTGIGEERDLQLMALEQLCMVCNIIVIHTLNLNLNNFL